MGLPGQEGRAVGRRQVCAGARLAQEESRSVRAAGRVVMGAGTDEVSSHPDCRRDPHGPLLLLLASLSLFPRQPPGRHVLNVK